MKSELFLRSLLLLSPVVGISTQEIGSAFYETIRASSKKIVFLSQGSYKKELLVWDSNLNQMTRLPEAEYRLQWTAIPAHHDENMFDFEIILSHVNVATGENFPETFLGTHATQIGENLFSILDCSSSYRCEDAKIDDKLTTFFMSTNSENKKTIRIKGEYVNLHEFGTIELLQVN